MDSNAWYEFDLNQLLGGDDLKVFRVRFSCGKSIKHVLCCFQGFGGYGLRACLPLWERKRGGWKKLFKRECERISIKVEATHIIPHGRRHGS